MKNDAKPLLAVTLGDITGIGPEIVVKVAAEGPRNDSRLLILSDEEVLRLSFDALGMPFDLPVFGSVEEAAASDSPITVLDLAQGGQDLLALARPHREAGKLAAAALASAVKLALDGSVSGVVYGPLVKETLQLGEKKYNDEYGLLQDLLDARGMKSVAKIGDVFRVTIAEHVPLSRVPEMITAQSVRDAIAVMREALLLYGLKSPRIAVAALNPHAGEGGMVGREEIDIIGPAIEEAKASGADISGPIPADTVYVRAFAGQYDGVVNLYHDQANIALKMAGFGEIAILYVRSPIVITTPSHGPAYGKAGKGTADHKNMRIAVEVAAALAQGKAKQ
jgi:4-hydroxythreonine-4-phosphate dehydrogenase